MSIIQSVLLSPPLSRNGIYKPALMTIDGIPRSRGRTSEGKPGTQHKNVLYTGSSQDTIVSTMLTKIALVQMSKFKGEAKAQKEVKRQSRAFNIDTKGLQNSKTTGNGKRQVRIQGAISNDHSSYLEPATQITQSPISPTQVQARKYSQLTEVINQPARRNLHQMSGHTPSLLDRSIGAIAREAIATLKLSRQKGNSELIQQTGDSQGRSTPVEELKAQLRDQSSPILPEGQARSQLNLGARASPQGFVKGTDLGKRHGVGTSRSSLAGFFDRSREAVNQLEQTLHVQTGRAEHVSSHNNGPATVSPATRVFNVANINVKSQAKRGQQVHVTLDEIIDDQEKYKGKKSRNSLNGMTTVPQSKPKTAGVVNNQMKQPIAVLSTKVCDLSFEAPRALDGSVQGGARGMEQSALTWASRSPGAAMIYRNHQQDTRAHLRTRDAAWPHRNDFENNEANSLRHPYSQLSQIVTGQGYQKAGKNHPAEKGRGGTSLGYRDPRFRESSLERVSVAQDNSSLSRAIAQVNRESLCTRNGGSKQQADAPFFLEEIARKRMIRTNRSHLLHSRVDPRFKSNCKPLGGNYIHTRIVAGQKHFDLCVRQEANQKEKSRNEISRGVKVHINVSINQNLSHLLKQNDKSDYREQEHCENPSLGYQVQPGGFFDTIQDTEEGRAKKSLNIIPKSIPSEGSPQLYMPARIGGINTLTVPRDQHLQIETQRASDEKLEMTLERPSTNQNPIRTVEFPRQQIYSHVERARTSQQVRVARPINTSNYPSLNQFGCIEGRSILSSRSKKSNQKQEAGLGFCGDHETLSHYQAELFDLQRFTAQTLYAPIKAQSQRLHSNQT